MDPSAEGVRERFLSPRCDTADDLLDACVLPVLVLKQSEAPDHGRSVQAPHPIVWSPLRPSSGQSRLPRDQPRGRQADNEGVGVRRILHCRIDWDFRRSRPVRMMGRKARLYNDSTSGGRGTCQTGSIDQQVIGALRGAKVRDMQPGICLKDSHQTVARQWLPTKQHLCPNENIPRARSGPFPQSMRRSPNAGGYRHRVGRLWPVGISDELRFQRVRCHHQ